jgi:hypothetical protein
MNTEFQDLIDLHRELGVLLKKAQSLLTKETRMALWGEVMPLIKQMLRQMVVVAEKHGFQEEAEELLREFNKEMEVGIVH